MLIWILKKTFGTLIGKLSDEQKRELWIKFISLIEIAAKSAAEGAVRGAQKRS